MLERMRDTVSDKKDKLSKGAITVISIGLLKASLLGGTVFAQGEGIAGEDIGNMGDAVNAVCSAMEGTAFHTIILVLISLALVGIIGIALKQSINVGKNTGDKEMIDYDLDPFRNAVIVIVMIYGINFAMQFMFGVDIGFLLPFAESSCG